MSGRVLGIELRRSTAWLAAALVVVTGAGMLGLMWHNWGGRWLPLALYQREQLYLIWPMAVGAGAWQARRESRCRVGELLDTTARPSWQRVLPTATAMALGTAGGYLLMFALGATQVVGRATHLPAAATATVVLVGLVSVVGAAWWGLAVGRLLPSPLTAPAATLAALLLVMSAPLVLQRVAEGRWLPSGTLLSPVLTPAQTDFVTVAGRVQAAQAIWLIGLAVTGLALCGASRLSTRLVAVVPALLGLVGAAPLLPPDTSGVYVPDGAAVAPVCTVDTPRVCVSRVHATALTGLRGPAREALAVLARKLPDLPDAPTEVREAEEDPVRQPQPRGTILVALHVDGRGHPGGPDELRWNLLDGAGTRPCLPGGGADAVVRQQGARLAVAAWLLNEAPPPTRYGADQARLALAVLRQLPEAAQRARVGAVRAAALACAGPDLLDLLIGVPATPGARPR